MSHNQLRLDISRKAEENGFILIFISSFILLTTNFEMNKIKTAFFWKYVVVDKYGSFWSIMFVYYKVRYCTIYKVSYLIKNKLFGFENN